MYGRTPRCSQRLSASRSGLGRSLSGGGARLVWCGRRRARVFGGALRQGDVGPALKGA